MNRNEQKTCCEHCGNPLGGKSIQGLCPACMLKAGWPTATEDEASTKGFALPTIDELTSLLEPEKQSNGLYVDIIFDKNQRWCWSSDLVKDWAGLAWYVNFYNCEVNRLLIMDSKVNYVRAVRAGQ